MAVKFLECHLHIDNILSKTDTRFLCSHASKYGGVEEGPVNKTVGMTSDDYVNNVEFGWYIH